MSPPVRVAVLGGGLGGLATALHLTAPERHGRFEVTIYESRWALGGKAASGRDLHGDGRIEEHGLHLWFATYNEAAELMHTCFTELDRPPEHPIRSWETAFVPREDVWFMERHAQRWEPWPIRLPWRPGTPGRDGAPTLWTLAGRALDWMAWAIARLGRRSVPPEVDPDALARAVEGARPSFGGRASRAGLMALAAVVRRAVVGLDVRAARVPGPTTSEQAVRRVLIGVELATTALLGALEDDLFSPPHLDRINHVDLKEWLRRHGSVCADAAPVKSFYSGLFAHAPGGGPGALAAGVGLRAMARSFLDHKGAMVFEMRTGMGEAVVEPLYAVLRRRGVRFAFFHRVDELGSAHCEGGRRINRLALRRLATPKDGDYRPTVPLDVPGFGRLDVWPSEPLYEQLEGGEALRALRPRLHRAWPGGDGDVVELHAGVDFDEVVLAVPPRALAAMRTPFADDGVELWHAFLDDPSTRTQSVDTIAAQVWLHDTPHALGWIHSEQPVIGGLAAPFEVCSDASSSLAAEPWDARPAHVAYLCGVRRPDGDVPARVERSVRAALQTWIEEHGHVVWPTLVDGQGKVDWARLVDSSARDGAARLDAQHVVASTVPSDAYVLSAPGTIEARPSADVTGYTNLTVAGDWTRTGLDCGCVEATVISGRRAAEAITARC